VMVGQLYGPNDPRRDGAFTIFYMGINLGAFIAPLVCGYLGEKIGWHWGFGAAAVGMILGLITYLIGRPTYLKTIGLPPTGRSQLAPLFFLAAFAAVAGFTWIYHHRDSIELLSSAKKIWDYVLFAIDADNKLTVGDIVSYTAVLIILVLAVWFVAIQKPGEKGP